MFIYCTVNKIFFLLRNNCDFSSLCPSRSKTPFIYNYQDLLVRMNVYTCIWNTLHLNMAIIILRCGVVLHAVLRQINWLVGVSHTLAVWGFNRTIYNSGLTYSTGMPYRIFKRKRCLISYNSLFIGRVSDPDPHGSALIWVARSGSRRAKMTHKNRNK